MNSQTHRRGAARTRRWRFCALVALASTLVVIGGLGPASAASPSALPANTTPPTLIGNAKRGATVAASTGVWTGSAPIVFTYQWQRCDVSGTNCVSVGSATSATRTLASEAVGRSVRVVVTATNSAGSQNAPSPVSAIVTPAADSAPRNVVAPRVTGDARLGARVRARAGAWNGVAPLHFGYEWQRCDSTGAKCVPIAGATGSRYVVGTADVGGTLRSVVTAGNGAGTNTAVTEQTVLVAGLHAPVNTAPPSVTGSTRIGSRLVARTGTWTGSAPISYGFQWYRCDASGGACAVIGAATAARYRTTTGDAGHRIRVLVAARNAAGTATLLSDATGVVSSPTSPTAGSAPRISGTARQGAVLTLVRGSWSGSTPITVTFQWLRCDASGNRCATISNATDTSYRLGVNDVNHSLRVAATGANSAGRSTVVSDRTATVQPSPPVNTGQPTVTGTTRQGSTLTANAGRWESYTPITFTYQWTRCNGAGQACTPIPGEIGTTRRTYTLAAADVGHRIFVQIKAQNSVGPTFANSAQTASVGAATGPPPAPPTTGGAVPITSVSAPNRLLVDKLRFVPARIHSRAEPLVARIHVIEKGGKPVSGALVYGVGVPFDRLSSRGEVLTGPDGWATITFQVLPTFRLRRGNLVVVFVRARKPGESSLGGVSTRRLVSVRVG